MSEKITQPSIDGTRDEWLVYADSLQASGNPLGELIALHDKNDSSAAEHLQKHAEEILGKAGAQLDKLNLAWRFGLIQAVQVMVEDGDDGASLVNHLLDCSRTAELQELSIIGVPQTDSSRIDLEPVIRAALEALPGTCASVHLVDQRAAERTVLTATYYDPDDNLVSFGDLKPVFAHGAIRDVEIVTADPFQLELGGIQAPQLESFRLRNLRYAQDYGEGTDLTRWLSEAQWPKLKRLEVRLCETLTASVAYHDSAYREVYDESRLDEYGDDGWSDGINWAEEITPLLESLKKVPIEHLALTSFESSETLVTALRDVGLPETLRVLDLSDSTVTADQLMEPGPFAQLDKLIAHHVRFNQDDAKKIAESWGCEVDWELGHPAGHHFLVGME